MLKEFLEYWQQAPKRSRNLILVFGAIYTALALGGGCALDRGLWRYYQAKYADVLISLDEAHLTITAQAILDTTTPTPSYIQVQPPSSKTPSPTPTQVPTTTPASPSPTSTLIPTVQVNGTCDKAEPPCLYYGALSWQEIASRVFSDPEQCRWPEIADANRRENGHYLIPLPSDIALYRPVAAPLGTIPSMIRHPDGTFTTIPLCTSSAGKPCVFIVPEGMFGDDTTAYRRVALATYGDNAAVYADKIMDANLASNCSGDPESLEPGVRLVIPK